MSSKSRYAKAHGLNAGQSRQRFKDLERDVAELKEQLKALVKDADVIVAAIAFAQLAAEFDKIEVEWDNHK